MPKNNYIRLTLAERIVIRELLEKNKSKTYIAKALRRSTSTITREVNKWVIWSYEKYDPFLAHYSAQEDYQNRRNTYKIDQNSKLKFYIFKKLSQELSPEMIANRIKMDYPDEEGMRISHEAIYQYICLKPQAKMNKKLIKLLHRSKPRRYKPRPKGGRTIIQDRVGIEDRPKSALDRQEEGHWEGDLIIGKDRKHVLGTLVERKTRNVIIVKPKNRSSKEVVSAFSKRLNQLDVKWRKTLTYDNGTEMAKHKLFTSSTGMNVYFADPYSSWQRGTNENTNGLIRRFLPKGTNFKNISEKHIQQIEDYLNNRPRKVLGFLTPNEAFNDNTIQRTIFSLEKPARKKAFIKKKS